MKAIQVQQTGGPEVLQLVDLPVPQPKPNEVLVKIAACGVNFIDTYQREGRYKVPLPFILGQEAAGVVSPSARKSLPSSPAIMSPGPESLEPTPNTPPFPPIAW